MSESQQPGKPLASRLEHLDRRIGEAVEQVVQGLRHQIGERLRNASEDMLRSVEGFIPELPESFLGADDIELVPEEAPPSLGSVITAIGHIDDQVGQANVLAALLDQSAAFSTRAAFFLIRDGQVRCWSSRGFDRDLQGLEVASDGPWSTLASGDGALALTGDALTTELGVDAGAAAVLVPFSLRGAVAGALYADQVGDGVLGVESLQLLTYAATQALETSVVSPGRSPALTLVSSDDSAPLPDSEATPAAEATPEETTAAAEATPEEDDEGSSLGVVAAATAAVAAAVVPTLVSEPAEEEESEAAEPAAGDDEPEVDELPTAEVEAASKEEEDLFEATVSEEVLPAEATLDTSAPPPVDTPAVEEMSPIEDEVPVVEAAPVAESAFEVPEMTPAPVEEAPVEPLPVEEAPVESVSAPASEEVTAPIATGDIAAMTEPPVDEPDPGLFDTSSEIQLDGDLTSDEIAQEVEPEPELEDTNIWELEDEEDDDDEPTQVGTAVAVAPEPAVGQQTVRLDISALQDQAAAASDSGAEALSQSPEPVAPEPVAPAPVDVSEDPTIMGMTPEPVAEAPPAVDPAPSVAGFAAPPPSFTEPAPPPPSFVDPPPPEPPAAEAPAEPAGGSTQVQPPSDLEGPGLAFATPAPTAVASASSDEEALHEEARRLARLLVSEIKLYNEEIIEEGRRRGNIYERLKDDIDRSRQMYEERIDPRLADKEDYFYQELVQRLAGGDEKLLGM